MIQLNSRQKKILNTLDVSLRIEDFLATCEEQHVFEQLEKDRQLAVLKMANALYRAGEPLIDDALYDRFFQHFKRHHPQHEYVQNVEPEPLAESKTIDLPVKMLSTDKAYSKAEVVRWLSRIEKVATTLGIERGDIEIRVTPKLDGYAAYDDGKIFYTRGDGSKGRDISFVFERGLKVCGRGKRGLGQGEIVLSKAYFEQYLSQDFENSRNIQAAILAEKNIDPKVQQAIDAGAAVFCPFSELPAWQGKIDDLLADFEKITQEILASSEYDVDGVILETTHEEIKKTMGATRHHHRWQIALKSNDEYAVVIVDQVIAQTSRNGKLTPVVHFPPTRLSGAEISRATAHHYAMVKQKGIGRGAEIKIVRSGLVIPKIEAIIQPATPQIPQVCPSCHGNLQWQEDNLFCLNKENCRDQIEKTIIHFFETLANNDGLGQSTVATFYDHGIRNVYQVYQLEHQPEKLQSMGYKQKTVQNLIQALYNSRHIEIEDWRFLAAFGVQRLGFGMAEKLLEHYPLLKIFDLSTDDLIKIEGFAAITANLVCKGLAEIRPQFEQIYELGFNLRITALLSQLEPHENSVQSPIKGKQIVFSGTMLQGKRSGMQAQAKELGAKIASSVSSKTDFLVIGEKVGKNKIAAAEKHGTKILTEAQYLALIS